MSIRSWFCSHNFDIVHEVTTESKFEQLNQAGLKSFKGDSDGLFDRKLIRVITCSKCGKTKKIVEII